jgi:hypothetical protein
MVEMTLMAVASRVMQETMTEIRRLELEMRVGWAHRTEMILAM